MGNAAMRFVEVVGAFELLVFFIEHPYLVGMAVVTTGGLLVYNRAAA